MPFPHLYYLERYRNKGTRTYSNHSSYTEASVKFQPDAASQPFNLMSFPFQRTSEYLSG